MSVQTSIAADRVRRGAALVLLLLPVVPAAAWSAGEFRGAPGEARRAAPVAGDPLRAGELRPLADRGVSMDEAVDLAQRRYNARVVRAEVAERGGRRVYLLRLLSEDGRVFNVRVDAETGSLQ